MAEATLKDLNYGHPGAASYDLDNNRWYFARQQSTQKFKQVRPWESSISRTPTLAIPASARFSICTTPVHGTSAQKASRALILRHPQLAASSGLLPHLAPLSNAIQNTAAIYDPLVSDLLSFGSTTTRDLHDAPRRIAAIPSGEAGNILRLAIIHRLERLSWGPDQIHWVEVPTLKHAISGYWNEDAAPIQQVCFAQSGDRNTILAIRLPTRTVFLRPTYHSRPRPAPPSQFYRLPASLIDAHPIISLGVDETGGAAHAHVAFNPDYQLQFGIVDQNRTWSVWDIEHSRKGNTYTITRLVHGSIIPPDVNEPLGEDGWARILWVGDINTILICCRRQLSVISMKGDTFEHLPCPDMFVKGSLDWILDVRHHPRFRSRVFILTSTCLVLMAVTTSSEALNATAGPVGLSILASWRHYRGAEDFTLQITVQKLSDNESGVVLHSRLNRLIQVYSFTELSPSAAAVVVASDPVQLDLTFDCPGRIAQLHIEPMECDETTYEATSPGPDRSALESGVRFYRLFATQSDFTVHELVISAYECWTDGSPPSHHDPLVFSQNFLKHKRATQRKEDVQDDEDFIIPDGLNKVYNPTTLFSLQAPRWTKRQARILSRAGSDYSVLHRALTWTEHNHENSISITDVVNNAREMLINDQDASPLSGTLLDAVSLKLHVPDVDEASLMLQELLISEAGHDSARVQCIASTSTLNLAETAEPTLSDVYDTVLRNWIAPLPREVPIHVRQRKERLARRIAAESMLASTRTRFENSQIPTTGSQRVPSQDSSIALPILPSKNGSSAENSTEQWSPWQPLPIAPNSTIPSSSIPPSSPPPFSPFTPAVHSDPVTRLCQHLKMLDNSPRPFIGSQHIDQLLEHWALGSDPHTYDWSATEVNLQEETEDEAGQRKREKDRKKRERREKRQERENELTRSKVATQPFPLAQSSQGPILGGMGSSSQVPSQPNIQVHLPRHGFVGPGGLDILAPMSQVEPGRFGGRPDLKKKRKKGRVSGF